MYHLEVIIFIFLFEYISLNLVNMFLLGTVRF